MTADSLAPTLWQSALSTRLLGRGDCRILDTVDSTNAELRRMALSGAPHGSLCAADMQSAGRGRRGRSWHSPAGCGLWLSVLLKPRLPMEKAPFLTYCAALAMARAVAECSGLPIRIKWPNDLVCRGKKLCGILLETAVSPDGDASVIVGTGLNLRRGAWPPELAHQATSLEEEGALIPRSELLPRYLLYLEQAVSRLEEQGFAALAEEYTHWCCTLGSQVQVSGSVSLTGVAQGLDDDGALLVSTDDGVIHRVLAGDVSVRGVMGYV